MTLWNVEFVMLLKNGLRKKTIKMILLIMNDKEKLEAIEKIINKKAEELDDLPWSKREETNKLLGGVKQSEYKKILKETAEAFFNEVEMFDYELNKRCKKEITEYFDKLFKDPEFERMITKAMNESPERYGD